MSMTLTMVRNVCFTHMDEKIKSVDDFWQLKKKKMFSFSLNKLTEFELKIVIQIFGLYFNPYPL